MAVDTEVRSRAREAYLRLRYMIIAGDLPPLCKLKVVALTQDLGVNSSAVREALSRLAAEHMVEARDQQGFRVAAISIEDLEDLTRTRIDIETMMLRRSIALGDTAWEARVRHAYEAVSSFAGDRTGADGIVVHNLFHETLLAACASPALIRIRASLFELSQRYRSVAMHGVGLAWQVDDQHDEIAAAVLARDADRAAAALADHIATTATYVRELLIHSAAPANRH